MLLGTLIYFLNFRVEDIDCFKYSPDGKPAFCRFNSELEALRALHDIAGPERCEVCGFTTNSTDNRQSTTDHVFSLMATSR